MVFTPPPHLWASLRNLLGIKSSGNKKKTQIRRKHRMVLFVIVSTAFGGGLQIHIWAYSVKFYISHLKLHNLHFQTLSYSYFVVNFILIMWCCYLFPYYLFYFADEDMLPQRSTFSCSCTKTPCFPIIYRQRIREAEGLVIASVASVWWVCFVKDRFHCTLIFKLRLQSPKDHSNRNLTQCTKSIAPARTKLCIPESHML